MTLVGSLQGERACNLLWRVHSAVVRDCACVRACVREECTCVRECVCQSGVCVRCVRQQVVRLVHIDLCCYNNDVFCISAVDCLFLYLFFLLPIRSRQRMVT